MDMMTYLADVLVAPSPSSIVRSSYTFILGLLILFPVQESIGSNVSDFQEEQLQKYPSAYSAVGLQGEAMPTALTENTAEAQGKSLLLKVYSSSAIPQETTTGGTYVAQWGPSASAGTHSFEEFTNSFAVLHSIPTQKSAVSSESTVFQLHVFPESQLQSHTLEAKEIKSVLLTSTSALTDIMLSLMKSIKSTSDSVALLTVPSTSSSDSKSSVLETVFLSPSGLSKLVPPTLIVPTSSLPSFPSHLTALHDMSQDHSVQSVSQRNAAILPLKETTAQGLSQSSIDLSNIHSVLISGVHEPVMSILDIFKTSEMFVSLLTSTSHSTSTLSHASNPYPSSLASHTFTFPSQDELKDSSVQLKSFLITANGDLTSVFHYSDVKHLSLKGTSTLPDIFTSVINVPSRQSQVEYLTAFNSPVPSVRPYITSLTLDITPIYQDGFSLSYSMEHDPGSGDYLETVSVVASQKKALTSSLTFLTDIYDPYDSNLEILDTSFPSRPLVSHSSFFDNSFTFSLDSISTFKTGLNTVLPAALDPLYIQSSMSHSFVKFSDDASNYPVYMTKSDLELEDSYLDFSDATSHYVALTTKLPISKQQPNVTDVVLPVNSETRKSESKSEETDALSVPESTSIMQEPPMENSFASDVFLHKTSSFSLDILPSHLPTVWFSDSSDKTPLPSQVYSKESTQFSVMPIFPSTILPWKLASLELAESSIMPDNFATVDGTNIDASDFIPLSSSNSLLTTVFVSDIPPVGSSETQFYSDVSVLSKEALDSQSISEQSFTSGVLRATSLMEALSTYSSATVLPATTYPFVSSHLKEENSIELLNTLQQAPQRTESVFSHIKSDVSLISSTVSQSLHLVDITSTSHFSTHMASSSLYVSVSPTPTGPVFMVSSFSKTATTSAPNTSLIEVTNLTNAVSTMTDKAVTDVYSTNNMNPTTVTQITGFPSAANRTTAATASSTTVTTIAATASTTTTQPYLCDITVPDVYLVKAVLSEEAMLSINEAIKNQLQFQFNRTVELQIRKTFPELTFLVTSGPLVYTAESVINALSNSSLLHGEPPKILSLQRVITVPDYKFQAHTVLQFVPGNVDVRFCNFSRQIERGLMMAFAAARRRYRQMVNISVQVLNVTMYMSDPERLRKGPVNITFAINDQSTFILGADVSDLLRLLSLVEFSFYLGFPVLQVAEPFHYPELNVSHILQSSWIRTVLLGVLDSRVREKVFHAEMERKFAQLFSEAIVQKRRRLKRATTVGNVTVQVVNVSRIDDTDYPVEVVYFVEGQSGERLSAVEAASLINKVDIQKAAIILGYRVKGSLAQPVNKVEESPSENHNSNLWIIVGVVVPVIVVVTIIFILYWKLCRTDRLEFQPDTMSNIQQRQKTPGTGLQSLILCSLQKQQPQHSLQKQQQQQETQPLGCQLQAPTVKGFDFAKQHLGQQDKDDVLVLQEPASLPTPVKDAALSENGDVPSPKSRTPSKPSKGVRHRGRISPSDAESTTSEQSSGRETPEETPRHSVTTGESKQHRAVKNGPPQVNGVDEQTSSASIFDHVDRISRSSEASRRITNKIQLIAMQPIPTPPPLQNPAVPERVTETAKINKEIQTALRHKSEIEHHRNKIRLRAKRKGHYDFPVMDDDGIQDPKDRRKIYRKAQMQFDKILEPGMNMPTVHIEARRSSRAKRSPKQRRKHQMNGSLTDAEKDRLITTDSDGTYKRPPGVNNVAYISDPDVPLESQSPSPSDPAMYPSSPLNQPPPPYVPPQPSIEEARQQMHSLLDDAFALVAPTSQGNNVASTTALPGATIGQPVTSTPSRTTRATSCTQWTAPYGPVQSANIPFARYTDLGMASPAAPTVLQRQGYGPGFLPPTELIRQEQSQPETPYPNRGIYPEDIPAVARPRPVGSTTGSQIHQLTQVGITNRTGAQTADIPSGRAGLGQHLGPPGWSPYRTDEDFIRSGMQKDGTHVLGHQEYVSPPMYQIPRTSGRDPTVPHSHLQPSNLQGTGTCYNAEDIQRGHSSASLIKAIREELLRLSQKQSVIQDFHS
ncbi:UPF0606 protein KIAA1549 homolog isoform X2 [Protopterus annectens]|uniref:UPF0606 protein KIAA1549 homolog isoform X2 n=1 Tax=Protopterus annectens TaxID=7888 RepID=UPI001CFB0C0E|nr:UPF0606 protein KIAA1549 homolog isoform X2 [Protopterus annectens]